MVNIQKALATTQTYDDLYFIAKNAEPNISCWGARYITVKGYEGTLPLDALVKRISEMVIENPGYVINNYIPDIRAAVRKAVDAIYDKSDLQVKTANCFTWLLTKAKYFRLTGVFTPLRWHWRECEKYERNLYLSLRNAMVQEQLQPNELFSLKVCRNEPAERSFWEQLSEDWRWL